LWQGVKGTLKVSLVGEANDVGAETQVEEEIPGVAVVLGEGFGVEGGGGGGLVGEGAWYLCSKKTRTFGQLCFILGVGGVSIHLVLLRGVGLGLADGLEELCVQTLGAGSLDRAEDARAQLGAIVLFDAGAESFGHCGGCGRGREVVVVWGRGGRLSVVEAVVRKN